MRFHPKKIILSGGYIERADDGGRSFCDSVVGDAGVSVKVRVLECLFARDADNWEAARAKDADFFRRNLPGKNFEFVIAERENFVSHIESSDVVYFRGGDAQKLIDALRAIHGWETALGGKVVVGASAGAYALCEQYVPLSVSPPELRNGLGLIPATVAAHYRSDREDYDYFWNRVDELIADSDDGQTVIKLREGEFVELR